MSLWFPRTARELSRLRRARRGFWWCCCSGSGEGSGGGSEGGSEGGSGEGSGGVGGCCFGLLGAGPYTATLTNACCPGFNQSVPLSYTSNGGSYGIGDFNIQSPHFMNICNGVPTLGANIHIECRPNGLLLANAGFVLDDLSTYCFTGGPMPVTLFSCNPLHMLITGVPLTSGPGCCTGTVDMEITE